MHFINELSTNFVNELEEIEIRAWNDFCSDLSEDFKSTWGIRYRFNDGIFCLAVAKVDVLALNRVVGFGLYKPLNESMLEDTIEYFRKMEVPRFIIQLCPTILNEQIYELLRQNGFQHYSNWVRLYRDTELPKVINTELKVLRIGRQEADMFGHIIAGCFGWPEELKYWFRSNISRRGWYHYLAHDKELPVATAAMFIYDKKAWFGMASTLPDYRKHGAQNALISQRIKDAISAGCSIISVETAEDKPDHPAPSFHNILRMGFHEAYKRLNFIYKF